MAGTDSRFNATAFRTAIRFAMDMGLPTSTNQRATFRWVTTHDYAKEDPKGMPYDWTATPTTTTSHVDVQVSVAVEYPTLPGVSTFTPAGQRNATRATLTLLDEDYALVATSTHCLLGGNTYRIDYWAPPVGLFEVTVYQAFCTADDES